MNIASLVLLVINLTSVCSYARDSFCSQDISEAMFRAGTVVLAKVKSVKKSSSGTMLSIRISKVIKSDLSIQIKPKKKLLVQHKFPLCRPVKVSRKYIFSLSSSPGGWKADCRPYSTSKKVRRVMQHLFCPQCGRGPAIKQVSTKMNVKMNR